jgi:hypothetical protein
MTHFKLSLLASAAMGLATLGSASALPLSSTPSAGDNTAQNARIVCDQWGRCYNTRNRNRGARHYRNEGYYGYNNYGHNNGYYRSQRSYGYGPFGIFGN